MKPFAISLSFALVGAVIGLMTLPAGTSARFIDSPVYHVGLMTVSCGLLGFVLARLLEP